MSYCFMCFKFPDNGKDSGQQSSIGETNEALSATSNKRCYNYCENYKFLHMRSFTMLEFCNVFPLHRELISV